MVGRGYGGRHRGGYASEDEKTIGFSPTFPLSQRRKNLISYNYCNHY